MAKIIFTSRYLKQAPKSLVKNLVKYIATRPGAEKNTLNNSTKPVTKKQSEFINKWINEYPKIKESFEYDDYIKNQTVSNASELISSIAERFIDTESDIKTYVNYVANRPRVEKLSHGHGLWNGSDDPIDLNKTAEEISNHKGYIWTHVISLRREDAERLGYDNADMWQELVKSKINVISENMKIPIDDLKWYGAFHNESHHPHVHLIVYSNNPKKGYLTEKGIDNMRRSFGSSVFQNDLMHVYIKKDEIRKELNDVTEKRINELVKNIETGTYSNPIICEMFVQLSEELKNIKGRKVYGNLTGSDKKKAKNLVDGIVAEISKEKNIDELYKIWCERKDEIAKTYTNTPHPSPKLVDEKEFLKIKNMVINYAVGIKTEDLKYEPETIYEIEDEKDDNLKLFELPEDYINSVEELYDDSLASISDEHSYYEYSQDIEEKDKWLLKSAEKGNQYAQYSLAKSYAKGRGVPKSDEKAIKWYEKAAEQGNPFACFELGNIYENGISTETDSEKSQAYYKTALEKFIKMDEENVNGSMKYKIGKMFLSGKGTEIDIEKALDYFLKSAKENNVYSLHEILKVYRKNLTDNLECIDIGDILQRTICEAEQNNDFAAYSLGCFYAFDKNHLDMEKAMYWLKLSADNGNVPAAQTIEFLNRPWMSPEQAVINLLNNVSKIITNDMEMLNKKYFVPTDKKLMRKILEKKQAQGQKQSFD